MNNVHPLFQQLLRPIAPHHTSYAAVHVEPPICKGCGRAMFSGLVDRDLCKDCQPKEANA
jgi:hypothetical protein